MALKVKRAGAAEYGQWVKALIVGDPGAGKTRTASTWPDALYVDCEGGLMSVADRGPAVVEIEATPQFRELLGVLRQTPDIREKQLGVPAHTVIVDTLDEVARIIVKERLESERHETMAIQDWGYLGDQLRNLVRSMRNLDMNVIFNVHVKSQEDSETGRTVYKPSIQGAMGDELAAYVDLALLMVARPVTHVSPSGANVREISRFFQTYPDSQHPWVKDRSGKLPMEFPINFEDDYQRLHGLVYATIPPVAATVVSNLPTTPTIAVPPAPIRATGARKVAAKPESKPDDGQTTLPDPGEATTDTAEAAQQPVETPEVPAASDTGNSPVEQPETPEVSSQPETVPESGTVETGPADDAETSISTAVDDWQVCQTCGGTVENKDQADLSFIRYKAHLCRSCFADRKKNKATTAA